MMEAVGAVGAAWSAAARGWLTPAVLFVAINLVIAAIAVASRLMSPSAAPGGGDDDEAAAGERRGVLLRAPSFLAVDRLRSSFSFGDDDDEAAGERRGLLLRAPSFLAVNRLRSSFSFSRLGGLAPDDRAHVVQPLSGDRAPEPSSLQQQQQQQPAAEVNQQLEAEHHQGEEEGRIERSRSEAAAEAPNNSRRRPRARARAQREAAEELAGHGGAEAAAVVEVDARADDFIRRFREQLRLQRLDSILRYRDRDSLRRTGTA